MPPILSSKIHERAVEIANRYIRCESELLNIFRELDETKAFLHFGANSLFDYSVRILNLSEATTSNLITVARKTREVPELKVAIESGRLSISKAKKISSVITSSNQEKWLALATSQTSRVIEKEVAYANPALVVQETIKYKTAERLEIKFGISEQLDAKLKRVKDLIAQKTAESVSSEKALETMVDDYLRRHDPVEKATRVTIKKAVESQQVPGPILKASVSKRQIERRTPLPARIIHAVSLRDRGQCTYQSQGNRCSNKRWIEIHHINPVSQGGSNRIENLTTLCSSHHKLKHT